MISYRSAYANEAETIARLHAASWQKHYRGILRDTYLDQDVAADRLQLWQGRFQNPKGNQHILVAVDGEEVCGFACTYAEDDARYGALLDNLHVLPHWQGQGIGYRLMQLTAQWVHQRNCNSGLYLWVYEENTAARSFYERIGGTVAETTTVENPGGGVASVLRIIWPDPSAVLPT
ncbi:GNAT family N-acetyltransferase [Tunicatimonas pelagia]|uniref:GNAT family N-acetyltransferase n=1 Tax=Tunicatimonas pelagia TaxID=931531 RepID=UPI002664E93B|nr:GNAT family N-acetyltransferase [Tunicatimonas pelagia]WKN44509.1 GNAT family N-acetyltransferase [Tunicatimonas pelagia]